MIRSGLRRTALLLIASAIAAGPFAVAPPASADGAFSCTSSEACVHITFPDSGQAPVDVPGSTIAANLQFTAKIYPTYDGSSHGYDQVTGLSLGDLLSTVIPDPINLDSVTYTLAQNPLNGYQSVLRAGDLEDDPNDPSPPFTDGLEPAFGVLGNNASAIQYIRPQRDDDDVNSPDDFQTGTTETTIDLQVHTKGGLIHPAVTIGAEGPFGVGQRIPFTATLAAGDPTVSAPTYGWSYYRYEPTQPPDAADATHQYDAQGTYPVSVTVTATAPDGGTYYGQSAGVPVQIGPAPSPTTSSSSTGGSGRGGKHHPKTGPNRGHGHDEGGAPTGGPTLGTAASGSPAAGSGPSGADSAAGHAGSVPAGATPSAGASSASNPPTSQDTSGVRVQGILITRDGGAAAAAPPDGAVPAAASARRAVRLSTPFDLRWLWVLAPPALLAIGALGERRRVPHRHGPQSRS